MIPNSNISASGSSETLQTLLSPQGQATARANSDRTGSAPSTSDASGASAPAPHSEESLVAVSLQDFTAGSTPLEDSETAVQAAQSARQSMLASPGAALLAQANLDPERAQGLFE